MGFAAGADTATIPPQQQALNVTCNEMTQAISTFRINWRQVLIHFIGMCLFIYAFQILVYLLDIKLVETIRNSTDKEVIPNLENNGTTITDIFNFSIKVGISGFIGLFFAFLISLAISLRKRWGWFTSVLTFLLVFLFYKLGILASASITEYFLTGTRLLKNIVVEYALWGCLFLIIGLFAFISKPSLRFISGR